MQITRLIECLDKITTVCDLFSLMANAARARGFEYNSLMILTPYNECASRPETCQKNDNAFVFHTYPDEWISYYERSNAEQIDPVFLYAPQFTRPFLWDQLATMVHLDQPQHNLLRRAQTFGLHDGVSVPIRGENGYIYVLSFATRKKDLVPQQKLSILHLFAIAFYDAYIRITGTQDRLEQIPYLAARELECLMWISKGKTSLEIGIILGICESTVNGYIRSIFRKMNVTSRSMAIMKADKIGLTNRFSH